MPTVNPEAVPVARCDRLIDAALALFACQGVDAASIQQIGRRAEVSPGLIYHYFASEEALLAAAMERHGFLRQLPRMLALLSRSSASEVLPHGSLKAFTRYSPSGRS